MIAGRATVARERGFTLIELLVAVVILGILAAIAIPQYTQYVTRSQRAAATQVLLQIAGELERRYTTNSCYDRTTFVDCRDRSGTAPTITATAPAEGTPRYNITVDWNTPAAFAAGQRYTLTATPIVADAACGNLTLTHTGERGRSGTGLTVARCWGR